MDTVLYFEGDEARALRVLRAVKNRFGSTNEMGVFEMHENGLVEVANPSAAFLAERPAGAPGSAVLATLEGSRPVLVEIQALVSRSELAMPRRTAIGLDVGRVALLLAVLEERLGLRLYDQDVFLNVAGGLRIDEPAADLAIVAAVASSVVGRPLPDDVVVWGEVGLAGEVRAVARGESRLREAATPGPTPTATLPPPYPAPNLLLPANGAAFTLANDVVTLQWASVGTLRDNEAYQVIIEDVTSGTLRITDFVTDTNTSCPRPSARTTTSPT